METSSWVIPKVDVVAYGSGRLRELFIKEFESNFKQGFTKVVVTRAGRLREWSQGERQLSLLLQLSLRLNILSKNTHTRTNEASGSISCDTMQNDPLASFVCQNR